MLKILICNGPNLNLLGEREPEIYGAGSLQELEEALVARGQRLEVEVTVFQSSSEGGIIDELHRLRRDLDGLIINPGGLTHTSVSLRDALVAIKKPVVEIHLSNIYAREPFRRQSLIADICLGSVTGMGRSGYFYALEFLAEYLKAGQR